MSNLYTLLSQSFPDRSSTFAQLTDGSRFTYADLEARSAQYAGALQAAGVTVGDRVAVQAEKSLDMLMLYLGCLRAGAVFLPLNTAYTSAELAYFIGDAEPALLVCDPAKRADIIELVKDNGKVRVETLDTDGTGTLSALADAAAEQFATIERADDDLAAILYTSGTTGRSKGAMLSHGNLASNALTLRDAWRFDASDVLLHALPIFHTHGLFVGTNVTLAAGASMIFLPRFDAEEIIAALPASTVMMGVPTFYIRLLADPRLNGDLVANMRLFISGSAPLSADIHREFRERSGHAILERYGMTETNMNTSNPYEGDRIPGSVGRALPGVSIRITDQESGALLETGGVGNIEIAGPNVFKGYWRMPEKTEAEFNGSHFVSGDLGYIDGDGYIYIVGRAKDLIIAGGYNIYPAEVESVLDELPEIRESAVIGVPHADLGEAVVAVVVGHNPAAIDETRLQSALEGRLARYKQPRRIIAVDELPKNTMGKIQKNLLRQTYESIFRTK